MSDVLTLLHVVLVLAAIGYHFFTLTLIHVRVTQILEKFEDKDA